MPGSTPTESRPIPAVRGLRPTATSSSSASTVPPPSSSTAIAAIGPADPLGRGAGADVDAVLAAQGGGDLFAGERLLAGRSRSSPSIRVTSVPSVDQAWASSEPTGPPPSTTMLAGIRFEVVASRLFQASTESRPSIGGIAAPLPVATITTLRAVRDVVADNHPALAVEAPSPRKSSIPAPPARAAGPSRRGRGSPRRGGRGPPPGRARRSPPPARRAPGAPRRAARPGAAAPSRACTRSRSTRRRPGAARRSRRSGRRRRAARRRPRPGGAGAEHDRVEFGLAHAGQLTPTPYNRTT